LKKPYLNLEETSEYIIREFSEDIDPKELLWHRDREDRKVVSVGLTDWQVQLDDHLPTSLNNSIFIKKYQWHRVIKGTGMLIVKIYKL